MSWDMEHGYSEDGKDRAIFHFAMAPKRIHGASTGHRFVDLEFL